jgi:RimJ/RimL family protein N-acetyltransferase
MRDESGKSPPRVVLETERLVLRELTGDDAEFILGLLNQPSFLRFVGDKGVRTVDDARAYIEGGPGASYRRHGYGLNLVTLRGTMEPIGICGLVNREWLEAPDLGFSLLPAYWSRGYACEASTAVLRQAGTVHQLNRILAITDSDNESSIRLLKRLGFSFWKLVRTPDGREELSLWSSGRGSPIDNP